MKNLTRDEVQERINLNPAQKKAWAALVRAVNRCRSENIYFYQVLATLNGLNGDNVEDVADDSHYSVKHIDYSDGRNLQWLGFPGVKTADSFADDTHFVILKD